MCAYTLTGGGALLAGAALARADGGGLVPGRCVTVGGDCRDGAELQALSSPDPQVTTAKVAMALLRVRI
jgi:hypothetical protein